MPYWKCYYHLVWATYGRAALIEAVHEPVLYGSIQAKAGSLKCDMFAADGTTDHIHLVVAIPPSVSVSEFVKNIKGVSAHELNAAFELKDNFQWQKGYGVLTLGESRLDFACDYVKNQKQHHERKTLINALEQAED
ncbi:MAG: IS200/IS605 family transposase [Anaerolineae bacterium]|nr:IS200/IS605 family transposase [Anaerolineae bacterium]